jgi:hypothetical protein
MGYWLGKNVIEVTSLGPGMRGMPFLLCSGQTLLVEGAHTHTYPYKQVSLR